MYDSAQLRAHVADAAARPFVINVPIRRWVAFNGRKRVFDVVLSGAALLALVLPLLVLCLLIRLDSPGPALFRQRRTGLGGRPFQVLKLRTMRVQEDGAKVAHATQGDTRVTSLGAFLRKTSLDELPQLVNVLRGDMSLVGPRPHALAHDEYYGALLPPYQRRFRVRPGLTGLAQVSGLRGEIKSLNDMAARVSADNIYIDHWSLRTDWRILRQTARLLLRDPFAY